MRGASLVAIAVFLVVLRLVTLHVAGGELVGGALGQLEMTQLPRFIQPLVLSLCFELCAVLLLVVLARRPPTRLLAKLLLGLLLLLDLAGTQVFVVLRTYAKGFQLTGLSVPELVAVAKAQVGLWQWLGLGICATLAWTFGRPGSIERAPVSRRTATLFLVLGVAAAAGVSRLILHPSSVPVVAHSPLTLLLVRPSTPTSVARGRVTADDWAPARELAPQWRALESVDRHFNLVVVVLESVRAEDFWPAATAPPLPQLQRRAEHSVAFTRAYAHEPLTVKGLEALLFGVYPTPFWEGLSEKRAQVALRSVPETWRSLGLHTAFFAHGEIPFLGERVFLEQRGFETVIGGPELAPLDPSPTDRTLVKAFDRYLDGLSPNPRFGVFLWPHTTHLPYRLPGGNQHPLNSHAAYIDAVIYLDAMLGDLFEVLDQRKLSEKTVVVLVADHGEAFGEHPESGLAHGDWLFEQTSHIPLVLVNPVLFAHQHDARLVQQKDVAATLTWLAGAPSPTLNLGNSLFFARPSEVAYLASRLDVSSPRGGLVEGQWKYLFRAEAPGEPADERLFNLEADPTECSNLWTRERERGEAMRERYLGWLSHWDGRWTELEMLNRWNDRTQVERVLFRP